MIDTRIDLEAIGSTSDLALRRAAEGALTGTAFTARRQFAGRGRKGNRWCSPEGNLYLSVIAPALADGSAAYRQMLYLAGISVADALRDQLARDVAVQLKWPNDVVIGGKKLAGIIVERARDGRLVIGIGVNVAVLPAGIPQPVTTLRELGSGADVNEVAARCHRRLLDGIETYLTCGFPVTRRRWLELSRDLGREVCVRVDGREVRAVLRDVDQQGVAVLSSDDPSARTLSTPTLIVIPSS